MDIRDSDLRRIDLNLLVALLVLLEERSVSKAAERLYLSQPALSGTLSRLRELFGDPLLVRGRTGMQPTSRALQLQAKLRPAMGAVHAALFEESKFDPSSAEQTFVVGMPDWVEMWLAPALFRILRQEAPAVRLSIVNTDPFRVASMLEQGEMDMAVCQIRELPSWCRTEKLREMPFKCISAHNPHRKTRKLSLKEYLAHTHLLISYRNAFESVIDKWLETQSLQRQVVFASTRFAILPSLLQQAGTLATVPQAVAERWVSEFGFRMDDCPVPLDNVTVATAWLSVRDGEPALRWLGTLLRRAI